MAVFPAPTSRIGVARADELVLRAAVSAYLGRYRGQTRVHTGSDFGIFLCWCIDQDLDPLAAVRVDIERYLRWLQVRHVPVEVHPIRALQIQSHLTIEQVVDRDRRFAIGHLPH